MFRPNVKLVLEPGAGARIVDEKTQRTLTLTPTEGRILALVGPAATAESLAAAAKGAGIDVEAKQIEALLTRLAANELVDYTPPSAAAPSQAVLLPDDVVPAFRTDLGVAPAPKAGLMLVTDKKRDRSFTLYDFEVHIARLLDGHHTVARVIELAAKIGMPVTPESLGKFIGQMKAYGFIQEGVLAPRAGSPAAASDTWPARAQWSAEIRELYQSALRQFRAGRPGHAIEYLDALLEIRPDTPEAAELKKRVEQHLESGPVMELSFEDLHGVDDPMPELVAASEPLLGGRTLENPKLTPVVATDGIPATSPLAKTVVTQRLPVPPPAAEPPAPVPAPPPAPAPKPVTSLLDPEPLQISVSAPRRSAPIFAPRASAPLPAPRPSTPRPDEPGREAPPPAGLGAEVEKPRASAPLPAPRASTPRPDEPSPLSPRSGEGQGEGPPSAEVAGEVEKPRPSAPIFGKRPEEPRSSPPAVAPKLEEAPAPKPSAPALSPAPEEPAKPRPSAPIFGKRPEEPRSSPPVVAPKLEEAPPPKPSAPALSPAPEAPAKPRPSAPIFGKRPEEPRPSPPVVAPKPSAPTLSPAPEAPAKPRPSAPIFGKRPEEPRPSPPVEAPKLEEAPAPKPSAPALSPAPEEPAKPRPSAPIFAKRPEEPRSSPPVVAPKPSAPTLSPPPEEPAKPRPSAPIFAKRPEEPRSSPPVLGAKTDEVPKARPSAPAPAPKLEDPSATFVDGELEEEPTHIGEPPLPSEESPLDGRGTEVIPQEKTQVTAAPERPAVTEPEVPAPAPRRSRPSAPQPAEEAAPAPRPSRPRPAAADGAVPDAPVRVRRSQPQMPKAEAAPPRRTALYAGIGAAVLLVALGFPIPAVQRVDVQLLTTPKAAPKFPAGAFGALKVQSGTRVDEGAVIATLDVSKQKAEKEELAKTITRLDQAAQRALSRVNPAALAKAKQNVAKAKADVAKAKQGLAKAKDKAKAELDVARKEAALERAERQLVAADATEKAKTLKQEATAARERAAKLQQQIDRAVVTAPATGVFELDALPPAGANFDEGTEFGRIVAPHLLVKGAPDDVKDPVLIDGERRIALFSVDRRPEGLTVPFEGGLKPGPAVLEVSKGYRPWPIALLSR